ncbi:Lrp/AsnC family transcriptional regulator [Candidatus Woesearchaeota archaeon]|nr:Lrp/AsnC family transcriptional regulator [Candidatus Woesearchaeota archaeon]
MDLDRKDFAILDVLKENSSLSTQKIARKLGIPITTVHNRIKRLEREKIIRNYTVNIDNPKIGKNVSAFILVAVDYKLLKEIKSSQYELARKIRSNPSVEEASMVTGATDIIIKVRVSDIGSLSEFVTRYLRNVDGVEKTQTAVILNEF